MTDRLTGKVKWFNNKKGYGFIEHVSSEDQVASEDKIGGEDVFVHYRQIMIDGFRTLREGQFVEYVVNRGPKGLQAAEVKLLEEELAEAY